MSRLPVHQLKTNAKEIKLEEGQKVYHLPDWNRLSHPERLAVLRQIAMMRGRDPRIAKLVVSILKKARARPRQYKDQAAALLKWVQDPKNIYYVNEPGERLGDPIYTIQVGHGDCDDQILVLTCFFESINLPWRLVLSGRDARTGNKVRYIEGAAVPPHVTWTHIYAMVGDKPFSPDHWYFCEPTVEGVPLGWDVIDGDHRYLPEMTRRNSKPMIAGAPPAPLGHRPASLPPPEHRSPAYLSGAVGASVGAALAETVEQEGKLDWNKISTAILTGVAVSVSTQLILDWVRGTGMWEDKGPITRRVSSTFSSLAAESSLSAMNR